MYSLYTIRAKEVIILSQKFTDALIYATNLHSSQYRKSTEIPYISHLMAVSSLVLEACEHTDFKDKREDLAIAALLHDAIEDQSDRITIQDIKSEFGNLVATIVIECSDSYGGKKPPWRQRKEAYISHITDVSRETQLVSCADKLHNARSIKCDYDRVGDKVWYRFNAGKDDIIWYYKELTAAFHASWPENPLVGQLGAVVCTLS